MYSPKIQPEKVERLYRLKISLQAKGEKVMMTDLVAEALDTYLTRKEKELQNSGGLLLIGEPRKDEDLLSRS